MKLLMDRFQPILIDMSVNLGRRNVRMSEQLLNSAQIPAARQQMGGKTVAEGMRCRRIGQAQRASKPTDFLLEDGGL